MLRFEWSALAAASVAIREKEDLVRVLEEERAQVTREMDRIYELYIADEIPKEGFGDRYRPLDDRRRQINDELPALTGELDYLKIRILSSDEIVAEAKVSL